MMRSPAGWRALPGMGVLAAGLAALWFLQPLAAAVYLFASVITFACYAIDKAAARHRSRRTPEWVLHALALVGGWPGALLAQRLLRHKSAKPAFQLRFWLTVCANVAVCWMLALLLGSAGG